MISNGKSACFRSPGATLGKALRQHLQPQDEVAEMLLLGKDDRTIPRRKAADFTIASLCAKIDAMTMRVGEMEIL